MGVYGYAWRNGEWKKVKVVSSFSAGSRLAIRGDPDVTWHAVEYTNPETFCTVDWDVEADEVYKTKPNRRLTAAEILATRSYRDPPVLTRLLEEIRRAQ